MSAAVILLRPSTGSISFPPNYYAKKLSRDKPPVQYQGGYIIYCNKTRWYLESYVTWRLYWIPESLGDYKNLIDSGSTIEYQCTWLPDSFHIKAIKRIIYTHPNLDAPNWYWQIRKVFDI